MKIAQKELINIVREELKEALGMDQEYERSQLAAKVRDLLDEYTGEDLEAAMDALNAVRAMLVAEMKEYDEFGDDFFSDREARPHDDSMYGDPEGGYPEEPGRAGIKEAHGLSKKDADYIKGVADETDDDELKRILIFLHKSNVPAGRTGSKKSSKRISRSDSLLDTYVSNLKEDFFSDSAKEEEAEAKQRAAQGETEDKEDDPGQYVTTSEACPGKPKRYFKLK